MTTIKLGIMPGAINEFILEDGTTVAGALEVAGKESAGFMVKVNGDAANLDTELSDGDVVILSKQLKGNA